jgi:hypothetical protein
MKQQGTYPIIYFDLNIINEDSVNYHRDIKSIII